MRLVIVSIALLCGSHAFAQVTNEAEAAALRENVCGSLQNSVGPWDYRTRGMTSRLRWDHADNIRNHYDPAIRRMNDGEYSERVIGDLDFLVRVWPNHVPGLRALIQYNQAGGKVYRYRTVECYLERARRFAPNDPAVALLEGGFYLRQRELERARKSFDAAREMQPDSMDVHYNLGLFYIEAREFDKAVFHAKEAYSLGYPLPGLKNRLKQLGHWPAEIQEPSASP